MNQTEIFFLKGSIPEGSVNDLVIRKRETGSLSPRRQGHLGGGKLSTHHTWVGERLSQNGELTLDELCVELSGRGVVVHRSSVGRLLHRLGLSHKKKPDGKRAPTAGDRTSA